MNRTATCSCGALRVTTVEEPLFVSMCHCYACQKRTGSIFGVQAIFAVEQAEIAGEAKVYRRTADSGNTHSFCFCPECGSTVYYLLCDLPDLVCVPVGAFADSSFPEPKRSVYHDSRRHPWIEIPDRLEKLG
jgi:hypothetical protein